MFKNWITHPDQMTSFSNLVQINGPPKQCSKSGSCIREQIKIFLNLLCSESGSAIHDQMTRFPNLVEITGSPNRCSKTEYPISDQKTRSPNLIQNTALPIQRKTGSSKIFQRIRSKIQGNTFLVRRPVLPIYSKRHNPQSTSGNWNTDSFIRKARSQISPNLRIQQSRQENRSPIPNQKNRSPI